MFAYLFLSISLLFPFILFFFQSTVGGGRSVGLNNILKSFDDEALSLIAMTNEVVLNPNYPGQVFLFVCYSLLLVYVRYVCLPFFFNFFLCVHN
jgi:hypothetical protein